MTFKRIKRKRRSKKTRSKISLSSLNRLTIFRSNNHIYAQIMDNAGSEVLTVASTNEPTFKGKNRGNIGSATLVGELIAKRAIAKGIQQVAFDRSGYKYHGRVQALAEAARKSGLTF